MAAVLADSTDESSCCSCAAVIPAEAAEGMSEPSVLKVDSSTESRAANVSSSSERDQQGFISAIIVRCHPAPLPGSTLQTAQDFGPHNHVPMTICQLLLPRPCVQGSTSLPKTIVVIVCSHADGLHTPTLQTHLCIYFAEGACAHRQAKALKAYHTCTRWLLKQSVMPR